MALDSNLDWGSNIQDHAKHIQGTTSGDVVALEVSAAQPYSIQMKTEKDSG